MVNSISVVIPAKDEEETVGLVVEEAIRTLEEMERDYEVVVVNDHSTDRTAEIAAQSGATVIVNPGSGGKGNALIVGFEAARGDILVMLDADYSHRPEDIPHLVRELERGFELVVGSRMLGGSDEYEIARLFGNVFLTYTFRVFFRKFMTDALNGFKVFRREVYTSFSYSSAGYEIEIELLANAMRLGLGVSEVSSHERRRAGGKMKSRAWRDGPKFLLKILKEGLRYRCTRQRQVRASQPAEEAVRGTETL